MADWVTISSLATAGGTLILAVATFGATRSANRSARLAELALQERRRPVLVSSRADDRTQVISWPDRAFVDLPGGGASVDAADGSVHLAISVRNVGAGLAVLQAWHAHEGLPHAGEEPPPLDEFRPLVRDQYIASGDVGYWQGAVRDPDDALIPTLAAVLSERGAFTVDLLYTDQVGGQRTISRFGVFPDDDGAWMAAAGRHWYLDAPAPR